MMRRRSSTSHASAGSFTDQRPSPGCFASEAGKGRWYEYNLPDAAGNFWRTVNGGNPVGWSPTTAWSATGLARSRGRGIGGKAICPGGTRVGLPEPRPVGYGDRDSTTFAYDPARNTRPIGLPSHRTGGPVML